MKRGTMLFFAIVGGSVLLSYISLPVFLVVIKVLMAVFFAVVLWFLLFRWWVVPLFKADWTPSSKAVDVAIRPRPKPGATACFKVLAGRQADRLKYAFGDDEYAEIQASLKARR